MSIRVIRVKNVLRVFVLFVFFVVKNQRLDFAAFVPFPPSLGFGATRKDGRKSTIQRQPDLSKRCPFCMT